MKYYLNALPKSGLHLLDALVKVGQVQLESTVVTNADAMVESALDTGASPTFRKGKAGGWREYAGVIPEWSDYEQ